MDSSTPLKHFTNSVVNPSSDPVEKDANFEASAKKLTEAAEKVIGTSKMVAVGMSSVNKKAAETLLGLSVQVRSTKYYILQPLYDIFRCTYRWTR